MNSLLHPSFPPEVIALYCAEGREGDAARAIGRALKASLFPGLVFRLAWNGPQPDAPVDPKKSARLQPERRADMAILAVAPTQTFAALRDAKKRGARTVLITGFSLPGVPVPALPQLRRFCLSNGITILGPDGVGAVLPHLHFNASLLPEMPAPGPCALIAQSPATMQAAAGFFRNHGIGASALIHAGLGDAAPWIDFLSADAKTRLIALELLSLASPRELLSSVRTAARDKTVAILMPAADARGAGAVRASLGDEPARAPAKRAFERCGAIVFETLEALLAFVRARTLLRSLAGDGIALLCDSPFAAPGLASEALRAGLALPRPKGGSLLSLAEAPSLAKPPANPFLISAQTSPSEARAILTAVLEDPGMSAALLVLRSELAESFRQYGIGSQRISGKPVLVLPWDTGERGSASTPSATFAGLAGLARFGDLQKRCFSADRLAPEIPTAAINAVRRDARHLIEQGRFEPLEIESVQILSLAGILVKPGECFVKDAVAALGAAQKLGFPLTAELIAPGSGKHFRQPGLPDAEALEAFIAYSSEALRLRYPIARLQGFSLKADDAPAKERIHIALEAPPTGRTLRIEGAQDAEEFLPLTEKRATLLAAECHLAQTKQKAFAALLLRLAALFEAIPEIIGGRVTIDRATPGAVLSARLRLADAGPDAAARLAGSLPFAPVSRQEWQLPAKGGALRLRALRPEDGRALQALFSRMSAQSIFRRFHFALPSLTERQTSLFVDTDPLREVALGVFVPGGALCAVGRARRSSSPGFPQTAEFAVAVEDRWQRRGIASGLLRELEKRLPEIRCRILRGEVLASNAPMIALLGKLGFKLAPWASAPGVLAFQKNILEGVGK